VDPEALAAARERVRELNARDPDVVELGALVSLAVHIEPALLRRARLLPDLAPHYLHPAVEADLWFSEMVDGHGPDGLVLKPAYAEALRAILAENPSRYERARALIVELHRHYPPELALEERVADLAARKQPQEALERELDSALAAMKQPEREGLADWAMGALGRLPVAAGRTATAWRLRREAERLRPQTPASQATPDDLRASGLTNEQVRRAPRIALPVRRAGRFLEIGAIGPGTAWSIPVPDTAPVLVELRRRFPDGDVLERRVVAIGEGQRAFLDWDEPAELVTAYGDRYELPGASRGAVASPRILVCGSREAADFLRGHGHSVSRGPATDGGVFQAQISSCDVLVMSGLDPAFSAETHDAYRRAASERGIPVLDVAPADLDSDDRRADLLFAIRGSATLGQLHGVPHLPDDYLANVEALVQVKMDLTPARRFWELWGAPGSGRSVLAAAIARDEEVRARYPGGIVWLEPGEATDWPATTTGRRLLADPRPKLFIADERDMTAWLRSLPSGSTALVIVTSEGRGIRWTTEMATRFLELGGTSRNAQAVAELAPRLTHDPAALRLVRALMARHGADANLQALALEPSSSRIPNIDGDLGLVKQLMAMLTSDRRARDRFLQLCVFRPGHELPERSLLDLWSAAATRLEPNPEAKPFDAASLREDLSTLVERGLVESAAGRYRVPGLCARWLELNVLERSTWESWMHEAGFDEFHRALLAALNPDDEPWSDLGRRPDVGAYVTRMRALVPDAREAAAKAKPPAEQPPPPSEEAPLLGLASELTCAHVLGRVVIERRASPGEPDVLTVADLAGAKISGCPNFGPTVKPCLTVLSPPEGLSREVRGPNGSPAVTQAVRALTDGTPPGVVYIQVRTAAPARLGLVYVAYQRQDVWSRQTVVALRRLLRSRALDVQGDPAPGEVLRTRLMEQLLSCQAGVSLTPVSGGKSEWQAIEEAVLFWRVKIGPHFPLPRIMAGRPEAGLESSFEDNFAKDDLEVVAPTPDEAAHKLSELLQQLAPPLDPTLASVAETLNETPADALIAAAVQLGLTSAGYRRPGVLPLALTYEMRQRGLDDSLSTLESLLPRTPPEAAESLVDALATGWVPAVVTETLGRIASASPGRRLGWMVEADHGVRKLILKAFEQRFQARRVRVVEVPEGPAELILPTLLANLGSLPPAENLVVLVLVKIDRPLVTALTVRLPEAMVLVVTSTGALWEDPRFTIVESPEPELGRLQAAAYEKARSLVRSQPA
jgi:hypothetical protein